MGFMWYPNKANNNKDTKKWDKQGSGLGPVYRNTGSVEILPHVQKFYKIEYVTAFQQSSAPAFPNYHRAPLVPIE